MQLRLDFNEGLSCILVPHPSTRSSDLLRSPFQVVRPIMQLFNQQDSSSEVVMCLHSLWFEFLTSLWYSDQMKNASVLTSLQAKSLCIVALRTRKNLARFLYSSMSLSQPTETKLIAGSSRLHSRPSLQRVVSFCIILLYIYFYIPYFVISFVFLKMTKKNKTREIEVRTRRR